MNSTQKTILTIFIPVVIFIAALGISNSMTYGDPFDWGDTWFIWVLALVIITIFLYQLYKNKK